MQHPETPPHGLPLDAQSILALAARSMFQLFSSISQGMFLVDRTGRILTLKVPECCRQVTSSWRNPFWVCP